MKYPSAMRVLLTSLLALSALSCADAEELTQIMVFVDSDIEALSNLEIDVEGLGDTPTAKADLGETPLPRSLGIVHRGGPLGPITVTVRGATDAGTVVERVTRLEFEKGELTWLCVELLGSCADMACGGGATCVGGACVPVELEPASADICEALASDTAGGQPDAGGGVVGGGDGDGDGDGGALSCTAPTADCDGDTATGCEVDLDTDVDHCGSCDVACTGDALPGVAGGRCTGGQCQLVCEAGRIDLDESRATGCEAVGFTYDVSNFDPLSPALNPPARPSPMITCDAVLNTSGAAPLDPQLWCGTTVQPIVAQQSDGSEVVIVALDGLTVSAAGSLWAIGQRPAILAVYGDARVEGLVSASAVATTPGAGGGIDCIDGAGATGIGSGEGGGGGGGGGHGTAGGDGGPGGDATSPAGGVGGTVVGNAAIVPLRGGCPGGDGGEFGPGGAGGGAIQLSVLGELTVASGAITASGGGGRPSPNSEGGGGGGGAGGAVLVEADRLTVLSWLSANGGGGGAGNATDLVDGTAGSDGTGNGSVGAPGGTGGRGGDGGKGGSLLSSGAALVGARGETGFILMFPDADDHGGGGGGGAVGRIRARGVTSCNVDSGFYSPAANVECP